MAEEIDPYAAALLIEQTTRAVSDAYRRRWVRPLRGKYRGHRAQIKDSTYSWFGTGPEFVFFLNIRDKKDQRFLYGEDRYQREAYRLKELEFIYESEG